MLTHFLDLLAAVISVTSLLIVTYGALIGIISFLKNEIRRFTGGYSITNIRKLVSTQFRAYPFERALFSALNRVLLIN